MRISHKLILGFMCVALLVGVVGYLSIHTSQEILTQSITDGSLVVADRIQDNIDGDIYHRAEIFQEYSNDLILHEAISKSNQEFEKLDDIQAFIADKDRQWTSATTETITPFMDGLINNELSRELREKLEFYEKRYGYKLFGEVFVTNKYGANVSQSGKTSDYYQADEQWWQNAKNSGLAIGDVEYDESAGIYSLDIGIRVDDEAENFLGVIKAVLNIEGIVDTIKAAENVGEHVREFKLLTKDGRIIYATEEFEIFEEFPAELLALIEEGHESGKHYFIAKGDKAGESEELFTHVHAEGHEEFKGLGWILIEEHETDKIFAPVAELRKRILIISTVILLLTLVMGILITRSFCEPISKLCDVTAEIGRGNFDIDIDIDIKSNDEVGQLSASFKEMVADLKKSTTSIDSLNDEITEREHASKEMERMNRLMTGREEWVIEMKKEVNALLAELDREPEYKSVLKGEEVGISSDKAG